MQSHGCYCFLPMTSLLLQPYHPRKDAIKIFGTGLNDVALQVSNTIPRKIDLPVAVVLLSWSSSSHGQSCCWKTKQQRFSASSRFAGAGAARWPRAGIPADIASRNAARRSFEAEEGPLSLCFAMWLLRVSAEFCIYISSHHHPVTQRESSNTVLLAFPAWVFCVCVSVCFFSGCLKEVAVVQMDVFKLIKE